jgi:protein-S-isoprenylcysteine O-methyltransferase Ste14
MTLRKIISVFLYFLGLPAMLILAGGDPKWWQAWVFVGMSIGFTLVGRGLMAKRHPDLVKERANFAEQQDTKPWDRILAPLMALWLPLIYLLIAALDHRFNWTGNQISLWVTIMAWLLSLSAYAISTWAMLENRFFSAVARIQKDRGQTVVESGPYRLVRHPGYTGGLLAALMFPLALGSLWAFLPVLGFTVVLLLRTSKEDAMLRNELPGYLEYARKVKYRLIPGIW